MLQFIYAPKELQECSMMDGPAWQAALMSRINETLIPQWASIVVEVEGGLMAFDSQQAYETWLKQLGLEAIFGQAIQQ